LPNDVTRKVMTLSHDSIDQFLRSFAANGASENTLRSYRADLMGLLEYQGESGLTDSIETTAAMYLTKHRASWAPATTTRKLAAFRAYGRSIGQPAFLAEYRAPKVAPGVAHPLPDGIEAILRMHAEAHRESHRSLVVLCGLLGLRCSEARSIRPKDFEWQSDGLTLRVRGKGDKTRVIPVNDNVAALLAQVLLTTPAEVPLVPLSDRAARRAWTRIGSRAGVHTATHDGRMTVGTVAYQRSGDLRAVQEFLGHADSKTTQGYTHIAQAKIREAANVL
jgi:integrase/recombinase XerC